MSMFFGETYVNARLGMEPKLAGGNKKPVKF